MIEEQASRILERAHALKIPPLANDDADRRGAGGGSFCLGAAVPLLATSFIDDPIDRIISCVVSALVAFAVLGGVAAYLGAACCSVRCATSAPNNTFLLLLARKSPQQRLLVAPTHYHSTEVHPPCRPPPPHLAALARTAARRGSEGPHWDPASPCRRRPRARRDVRDREGSRNCCGWWRGSSTVTTDRERAAAAAAEIGQTKKRQRPRRRSPLGNSIS